MSSKYSSYEQFIPINVFLGGFFISGETISSIKSGRLVLKGIKFLLTQKTNCAKSIKTPAAVRYTNVISIIIMDTALQSSIKNPSTK